VALGAAAGTPTRPPTAIVFVDPPAIGPNASSSSSSVSPEGIRESAIRWGLGKAAKAPGAREPATSTTTFTATLAYTHTLPAWTPVVPSLVITVLAVVTPLVKFMLDARGFVVPHG
jgi:hypothetical protein